MSRTIQAAPLEIKAREVVHGKDLLSQVDIIKIGGKIGHTR